MINHKLNRRNFLASIALGGLSAAMGGTAEASDKIELPFANSTRRLTPAGTFPEKAEMIVQRTRPPLLETPWSVLGRDVFTPNESFYVRWHLGDFPTNFDLSAYRVRVFGAVNKPYEISLDQLMSAYQPMDLAAVNQCSGNSRGRVQPRVPGAQWADGAMGNAMWTGVALSQILERAGLKAEATHVAFRSAERLVSMFPKDDIYEKVLPLQKAMDGNVMVAYRMNGKQMPVLNGFPIRLIVPGWYATYWVKMLTEIEVTTHPGEKLWMAGAYKIPDLPNGSMKPGQEGINFVPINAMNPRSFFANLNSGDRIPANESFELKGIAFGGNSGLKAVDISLDHGASWMATTLGKDWGDFSFRAWSVVLPPMVSGKRQILARATNLAGEVQPRQGGWNGGGFMYNAMPEINVDFV